MKRAVKIGLMLLAVVALSGCVDIVQYISGSGSTIDVYLRLTLQKGAFELANSFSDEPEDMDQMFEEEFGINESEVTESLPFGIEPEYTPVDSEFEFGFELRYSAPRSVLSQEGPDDAGFVPVITASGLRIPFAEQGDGEEQEAEPGPEDGGDDEFANAFLGGSRYRLMLSKRLVSRVREANLVTSDESRPVLVTELPDVWMIEFPTSLWLNAPSGTYLDVRF
jgi:hypothetical protein